MGATSKISLGGLGQIVKITCTGMHPTHCHSEWGEFGSNIMTLAGMKYAGGLKRGQPCQRAGRFGNCPSDMRKTRDSALKSEAFFCANGEEMM